MQVIINLHGKTTLREEAFCGRKGGGAVWLVLIKEALLKICFVNFCVLRSWFYDAQRKEK